MHVFASVNFEIEEKHAAVLCTMGQQRWKWIGFVQRVYVDGGMLHEINRALPWVKAIRAAQLLALSGSKPGLLLSIGGWCTSSIW